MRKPGRNKKLLRVELADSRWPGQTPHSNPACTSCRLPGHRQGKRLRASEHRGRALSGRSQVKVETVCMKQPGYSRCFITRYLFFPLQ